MFLFPSQPKDDPLGYFINPGIKNNEVCNNFSIQQSEDGIDNFRSLNVPFCINIMAGGRYSTNQLISLTSISDDQHYYVEKTTQIDEAKKQLSESIEMHHHDYFELSYVFEGEVQQHIEKGVFNYTKGTACLMNRNTWHYEELGESFFLVFLCISKDFIRDSLRFYDIDESNESVVYKFLTSNLEEQAQYQKDYLEFVPKKGKMDGPDLITKTLEELTKELMLKQPGHSHMVLGLLSRILAYLQDPTLYDCSHIKLDSSAEAYLFNKVARLMEHSDSRVSRAELSETLNYSSDYINRIVKKYTGKSISEYNQMICIKKAEAMLVETSDAITSIISSLGFENRTYFYKLFDRKHGMTPLEYRNKHKSAVHMV